jgi:outer membrane protein insertion porin family
MPIERRLRCATLLAGLVAAFTSAADGAAQDASNQRAGGRDGAGASDAPSLLLVDRDTRVASVEFRFTSGSALSAKQLREGVALDGPGALFGVRRALDFVPGLSAPELERFDPLTLQQDVVRLRQLYRDAGFSDVALDYEVVLDPEENTVEVTHVVDQGEPLVLDSVVVSAFAEDGPMVDPVDALPPALAQAWSAHLERLGAGKGLTLGEQERARLQNETADWFQRQGYPWARVMVAGADTAQHAVTLQLGVTTGPRARVDEIRIDGRQRLSDGAARREIVIAPGDWYDARRVSDGERELYELDLVARALGDVAPDQPRDSTVQIRFRIEEGKPRLVWGRIGWRSEAGIAGEAHWSHRDFLGGARTLTLSTTAETGWAAVSQTHERSAGVAVLIRQPYLGHRRVAGTVGPFAQYRDDFRDRSLLLGLETAVIYRWLPLEMLTLQHELSRRRVDDALQLAPIQQVLQGGDSASFVFVRSIFRLNATYGRLDDPLDPRSGFVVQPSLQVSGPSGISDVEFFRVALETLAAIPITEDVGLFLRATGGRLYPFGESAPPEGSSQTRSVVGLRGLMFTAGGTDDVRGWSRGLVGAKIPEVTFDPSGVLTSERYLPVGGLARLTGSAELVLPFPFLASPHRTYTFFDAGRVWTPGDRFIPGDPELRGEAWAYAVGGGLQFGTPVGPVRIGVGYKLNPTRVDLLAPDDVARDLAAGGDLTGLAPRNRFRWLLHLSVGRGL